MKKKKSDVGVATVERKKEKTWLMSKESSSYPKQFKVFGGTHMAVHFDTSVSVLVVLVVVVIIIVVIGQFSVVTVGGTSDPSSQGLVIKVILVESIVSIVDIDILRVSE
jgi:hypothetical protein